MDRPQAGISLMPQAAFERAAAPLFAAGEVEAVEWTLDIGWMGRPLSPWSTAVLDAFGAAGRLHAHGTGLSLLSGRLTGRQEQWLARLGQDGRPYRFVTEHFGWMTVAPWIWGPPLPPPDLPGVVALGRDRLRRMAAAAGCPVGLENLALALGQRDVDAQPDLLAELLEDVDGILHLDLHNLWTQAVNFDRDPVSLLLRYPLERVVVAHVSGGSWAEAGGRRWRRDTHDGAVPAPVWALLITALRRCRHLDTVVLEGIGSDFGDAGTDAAWRRDWDRLRETLATAGRAPSPRALRGAPPPGGPPVVAPRVEAWQRALLTHLPLGPRAAREAPRDSGLEDAGLETAAALLSRWGRQASA
jgi:uncharacterized protein (UPF0276 family)